MPYTSPTKRRRIQIEKKDRAFLDRTDDYVAPASSFGDALNLPEISAPSSGEIPELDAEGPSDGENSHGVNCYDSESDSGDLLSDAEDFTEDWLSSTSESDSEEKDLRTQISTWAGEGVSFRKVDELLKILRDHDHLELPCTARTLLKTPTSSSIQSINGGQILHVGFSNEIRKSSEIIVNVDGLPLYKSSSKNFWTILAWSDKTSAPEVVTVFCGRGKPDLEAFFSAFVTDLLDWKGRLRFVCDSPARSFIKSVVGHTAKSGCDRCNARGVRLRNRIAYPTTVGDSRTDQQYRSQAINDYHRGTTPLTDLPIDFIRDFVLDHMHLLYLGIAKKLLYFLTGKKANRQTLRPASRMKLSEALESFAKFTPSDFARKPRSTHELDRWKASELRLFLLYLVPAVYFLFERSAIFTHLLLLCFLVRSMYMKTISQQNATRLSAVFVQDFAKLYGEEYVSYNIHCLLHIAEEMGDSYVDAFMFEDYLQTIKRQLRSRKQPLQQLENRLRESSGHLETSKRKKNLPPFLECNAVYFASEVFILVNSLSRPNGTAVCRVFETVSEVKCHGLSCGVYIASGGVFHTMQIATLLETASKYLCLPVDDKFVLCKILHYQCLT